MLHRKKIIAISSIVAIIGTGFAASASIQPSSILGKVLGGNSGGSIIDRVLAQTSIDDEISSFLAQAEKDISSAKSIGLDSINTAMSTPVFRKEDGGLDIDGLLNKGQEGAWGTADAISSSKSTPSDIGADYILGAATVNAAREAAAANSESNKKLSKSTAEVFTNSAEVFNEVASTPAESSMQGIEQSNQIAMANGSITAQNTKVLQSVNRSLETSNALKITEQSTTNAKMLKSDLNSGAIELDSQRSRVLTMRRRTAK
jgi:hypothetical protein